MQTSVKYSAVTASRPKESHSGWHITCLVAYTAVLVVSIALLAQGHGVRSDSGYVESTPDGLVLTGAGTTVAEAIVPVLCALMFAYHAVALHGRFDSPLLLPLVYALVAAPMITGVLAAQVRVADVNAAAMLVLMTCLAQGMMLAAETTADALHLEPVRSLTTMRLLDRAPVAVYVVYGLALGLLPIWLDLWVQGGWQLAHHDTPDAVAGVLVVVMLVQWAWHAGVLWCMWRSQPTRHLVRDSFAVLAQVAALGLITLTS